VRLEEGMIILTEIDSSSEYNLEEETNTGSALPLYILSPPILPPPSFIPSSTSYLSQYDLHQIIRQQQE